MGDFDIGSSAIMFTNATDWTYYIGGAINGDKSTAAVPDPLTVSSWVQTADATGAWAHPSSGATFQNGKTIPEISPLAYGIWTTSGSSGDSDPPTDGHFVVFRAKLPANLPIVGSGDPIGIAGRTVFVDLNDDGRFNDDEPSGVTDQNGNYIITGVPSSTATYHVYETVPTGWEQEAPTAPDYYTIPAPVTGQTSVGVDFITDPISTNQPPTIPSPPIASPNPVTGTSTSLSVLGADDGGESNLTYYWWADPGVVASNGAPENISASGVVR